MKDQGAPLGPGEVQKNTGRGRGIQGDSNEHQGGSNEYKRDSNEHRRSKGTHGEFR